MAGHDEQRPSPVALSWVTGIDVLPEDRVLTRRDGYTVVRSPSNPRHHWGNLLIFDAEPHPGDGTRWEGLFTAEFGDEPLVRHMTFAWDRIDGELGAAQEFVARGYRLHREVALVGTPETLRLHPRADLTVTVRALDPAPAADQAAWDGVLALQAAFGVLDEGPAYVDFARRRLTDLRRLFSAGRGAWYAAFGDGQVVASCGIVVVAGRGRYQSVDTLDGYRCRGICSRLLHDAARHAEQVHGAERFVICADPDYHALSLYESLGFMRAEDTGGVVKRPPSR